MRKFLISGALIATALAANPASAQRYHGNGFDNRIGNLAERIDRAYDRGAINNRTARYLSHEVDRLAHLERRYGSDGRFTQNERYWINQRFQSINSRLRDAMGRRDRYDRNDRYDRRDRWDD